MIKEVARPLFFVLVYERRLSKNNIVYSVVFLVCFATNNSVRVKKSAEKFARDDFITTFVIEKR
jgi:hypothetical protein